MAVQRAMLCIYFFFSQAVKWKKSSNKRRESNEEFKVELDRSPVRGDAESATKWKTTEYQERRTEKELNTKRRTWRERRGRWDFIKFHPRMCIRECSNLTTSGLDVGWCVRVHKKRKQVTWVFDEFLQFFNFLMLQIVESFFLLRWYFICLGLISICYAARKLPSRWFIHMKLQN